MKPNKKECIPCNSIYINLWNSVSLTWLILLLRDICQCLVTFLVVTGIWWVESRVADKLTAVYMRALYNKELSGSKMSIVLRLRKCASENTN